jgi:hypothetical protein
LARALKSLRRPTTVGWALNQVARSRAGDVADYLRASGELREAQEHAGDTSALRATIDMHRQIQRRLVDAAAELIVDRGGNAESARDDLQRTVEAAALDPGVAARLKAGRLFGAVDPRSAFDTLTATRSVEPRSEPRNDARERRAAERLASAKALAASASNDLEQARTEVRRLERELARARAAEQRADAAVVRAHKAVQRAEDDQRTR